MNDWNKPFFLRSKSGLKVLKRWLSERTFNCGGYCGTDKKANPMVSIGYDYKPDNDFSLPEKRGLIVVLNHDLLDEVEEIVRKIADHTLKHGVKP